MSVTWVSSGNQYEVSSKEHLLQIMNQGSLYADAGSPPSNFWGSSYVQTIDIDLIDDHEDIRCIGDDTNNFTGEYDGGLFQISNWAYTNDGTDTNNTGLFGCKSLGFLKGIRLSGVWSITGYENNAGFLCGNLQNSMAYDVEGDFSAGTTLAGGPDGANDNTGSLFGAIAGSSIYGATVRGTVNLKPTNVGGNRGGVVGKISEESSATMLRNLATFPDGIIGLRAGGICAVMVNSGLNNCINAMQGSVDGILHSGGICGSFLGHANSAVFQCDLLVNSMTGNIGNSVFSGGIFGFTDVQNGCTIHLTKMMNYMTGDIFADDSQAGGIVGHLRSLNGQDITLNNSVIAMNGSVANSVRGLDNFVPSVAQVVVDASFGMNYTNNDYGVSSTESLSEYANDQTFSYLPYVSLDGADPDGKLYSWDFIFANLGGNPSYSDYTHLILHTGTVSAPFYADLGLAESNANVYVTYGNVGDGSLFTDGSLVVTDSTATVVYDYSKSTVLYGKAPVLICDPRPLNIKVTVYPLPAIAPEASTHKLTYQKLDSVNEIVAHNHFVTGVKSLDGLDPDTTYTIRVYTDSDRGAGYVLVGQADVTTDSNSAENYEVSDFVDADGVYDISEIGGEISSVMNDLFGTGDMVEVEMDFYGENTKKAMFVKTGDTVDVVATDALLLPFDASAGDSQAATITLSDSTSVEVSFNRAAGNVSIGGNQYLNGDTLILDGKKVTVFDI